MVAKMAAPIREDGSLELPLGQAERERVLAVSAVRSSAVASYFAVRFNALLKERGVAARPLTFVPAFLYEAGPGRCFAGEKELTSCRAFVKYNSNAGYVAAADVPNFAAVEAFSHFTLLASQGQLLVADLQGDPDQALLSDPQVLSMDQCYG